MAPLIKDTLETTPSASEPAQPVREKAPSAPLRADALSLEVRVKVHGSKVTEVGRGLPPRTEPFEEQSSTMIVFPQGGVLRLVAPVAAGQMLVVTNLKSGKDAICRVVKVRSNGALQSYVEIEFTARQPGYWGVNFPGDPVSSSSRPASAAQPSAAAPIPPSAAPALNSAPVPVPPVSPVKPAANPSAFAPIGSQEKIQPSASAISRPPVPIAPSPVAAPPPPLAPEPPLDEAKLTAAIGVLPQPDSKNAASSISLEDLIGDAIASAKSDSVASSLATAAMSHASPASTPNADASSLLSAPEGNFAASPGQASESLATEELFASAAAPSTRNWLLFAACVVAAFVAAAGGFFYLHSHSAPHSVQTVAAAPRPAAGSPLSAPSDSSVTGIPVTREAVSSLDLASPSSPQPAAVSTTAHASGRVPVSSSVASSAISAPAAAPPPAKPAVTTEMVTETLNAHPVAPSHSAAVDAEAPSVTSSTSGDSSAALPGAISAPSSISIPTPRLEPDGPVKVGGKVTAPRLISSRSPVYPQPAVLMNVQGDVVIQATVDKQGAISQARVVSGPALLRQAALDAFRRWKYAPSTLDGQPIDANIVVTLHFQHQ
ncbi:MAG TPA: TonB family protein [Candidatus Acidoferrum sp.]|nr:TonB family protein [Candidatus Acidoferrum sp.]